jgi:hypothetical protein
MHEREAYMTAIGTLKGIVRGKIIELERDVGLPDGQEVSVLIQPKLPPGEGLRRSFGAWSDDSEGVDRFVEETYRARESDRRNEPQE